MPEIVVLFPFLTSCVAQIENVPAMLEQFAGQEEGKSKLAIFLILCYFVTLTCSANFFL